MSESDWYDWLSEHEEIRGGRVQVMGLSRDRSPYSLSESEDKRTARSDDDADSDFDLDDVDPAYVAALQDLRMHDATASALGRRLERSQEHRSKGAVSPSPPRLDRRQLATPDERGSGSTRSNPRAHSSPLGPAKVKQRRNRRSGSEQEFGSPGVRRLGYTVGAAGPPARVSPGERLSAQAWMVRKEMRDSEERIIEHAEQVASSRVREAEQRVRERVDGELAGLRPLVASGELIREEIRKMRATNEDLRASLLTMTLSLREELATTRVDC